jgi:radical SAM/Cys-rich protein
MSRFENALAEHGLAPLRRASAATVQVNMGKWCNQACHHCHVDAGPKRMERMSRATAERVMHLLNCGTGLKQVDITGGAPELNENFRSFVKTSRKLGLHVIDRCNLTILLEPGFEDLPEFLALERVEIIASLPCYTPENVDKQRGQGVFDKSIRALQLLNRLGYGIKPELSLNLVYNPLGPSLPPPQDSLERDYQRHMHDDFGIYFNRLFTITNMPINRFANMLVHLDQHEAYMNLLVRSFNSEAFEHVMCRSLISIGWDGNIYDCDFNQMLEIRVPGKHTIWDIQSFDELNDSRIATGEHCFGCTAGSGSSCGGQLV